MTVAELISKLRAMPQDLPLYIPDEIGNGFRFVEELFSVKEITTDGELGEYHFGWEEQEEDQNRGLTVKGIVFL